MKSVYCVSFVPHGDYFLIPSAAGLSVVLLDEPHVFVFLSEDLEFRSKFEVWLVCEYLELNRFPFGPVIILFCIFIYNTWSLALSSSLSHGNLFVGRTLLL